MNKTNPPKWPLKFFRWFCNPDYVEDIEGDLLERFDRRPSKWRFTLEVVKLFRPGLIKNFEGTKKLNYYGMFKHNILISLRNFKRYRNSFLINLTGLASGLAAILMIYLWVSDELKIDKFHANDDRLYQVMGNFHQGDQVSTWNGMPTALSDALRETFPEIEKSIGATDPQWHMQFVVSTEGKKLKPIGRFVDKDFFHMFSYPLIKGERSNVLQNKNAILVSERFAKSLFGTDDVVGKIVDWQVVDDQRQSIITGVFEAPPGYSTDQFDVLVPFEVYQENNGVNMVNPTSVAYVLLKEGVLLEEMNAKIADFLEQQVPDSNIKLFLKKYSDSYLYGFYENGKEAGGRIEYVWLFSIIAIFILLIACINFMNLSTARASRRLKEVGIKKTVGALRSNLIIQYLSESILLTIISVVLAFGIVWSLLPQFNEITQKSIEFSLNMEILSAALLITLITGLFAGSYPAFYLSGFQPMAILKGKLRGSVGEAFLRKGLVVFQFCISIVLIIAVVVVNKQMQYVQDKHLGYDRSNLVFVENEGNIAKSLDTFLDRLKTIQGVKNASAMTNDIFNPPGSMDFSWESESTNTFRRYIVYHNFIETMGLTIKEGRTFSKAQAYSEIVLNESAANAMGFEEPIGQTAKLWGRDVKVVGVVEDFHYQSLHEESGPLFFHVLPPRIMARIMIRLEPGNQRVTLAKIEDLYDEFSPGLPFEYRFLDDRFNAEYEQEYRVANLSNYFALIAILISCLGLFGLAAFSAERRIKEIGIRKILGSTEFQIVKMLSSDFTKMVLLSIVIALPVSYMFAKNWLENFAFSIELQWWFFVGSGAIALIISWITVGYQTFKAARSNPSDALKYE